MYRKSGDSISERDENDRSRADHVHEGAGDTANKGGFEEVTANLNLSPPGRRGGLL